MIQSKWCRVIHSQASQVRCNQCAFKNTTFHSFVFWLLVKVVIGEDSELTEITIFMTHSEHLIQMSQHYWQKKCRIIPL